MDVNVYEAQADTIDVDDIASNINNRIVLRRLKRNNADENDELRIQNEHDDDEDDEGCYYPEGTNDMGWLGYFIGKNEHLEELNIEPFTPTSGATVRDVIEPFLRGVNCNKSIRQIGFYSMDLLGGEMFTMLRPFFENNHNLTNIVINNCVWGDEGVRLFALAIGSCTHKSLQHVDLQNNQIAEEGMVDIITSLSMHPHMKCLDLDGNNLRNNGCVALATLLQCSAKELQCLYISRNEVGDEGIEALVPALTNYSHLEALHLSNNPSTTTRGWQSLATILEAPTNNLQGLYIPQNNIDDEVAAAFASALTKNHMLHVLDMNDNPSITAAGWQAFSKILCNSSSVNATFLSNHTLWSLGYKSEYANEIIRSLLHLNNRDDKNKVAMIKILQSHEDFDMQPFFEWEFKVLPLVLSWLERASVCGMPENFEPNIEGRKLSTIYQFVRGMPVLYVETLLRKELEDIKARAKQMQEEQLRLQQEFMQQMQFLQKRQESILRRLGQPVVPK